MSSISALILSLGILNSATIENPWVPAVNDSENFAECLANEIQRQRPEEIIGEGDVYIAGPLVRVDYAPKGSALEMIANVPNAKLYPRLLTLSLVLEGVERSLWQEVQNAEGQTGFTNTSMVNPVLVFDRTQMKYLFELDLSACIRSAQF